MIAAIDSHPLSNSIFSTYDYSGLQVHLLTNRPLSRMMSLRPASELALEISGGRSRVTIPISPGVFWSDGRPVSAHDYLAGFNKVLALNPFIRRFLLRHLTRASVVDNSLVLEFSQINHRIFEVLQIPSFCPDREDQTLSSGDWVQLPGESAGYISHLYNCSDNKVLWLKMVKNPVENLDLFKKGHIDISADTAFPFDRIQDFARDPAFQQHSVGLHSVLAFSSELAAADQAQLRQRIADLCGSVDLSAITFGSCKASPVFDRPPSTPATGPFPSRPLRLAYDPFYPNRHVCELLAQRLIRQGLPVVLVEDDYYKPHAVYDLKHTILRGLHNSDYLVYCSLLMSEVLRNDRSLQVAFGRLLQQMEIEKNPSSSAIRQFIGEHGLLVPLFEIPSLYLSRDCEISPLTRGLLS